MRPVCRETFGRSLVRGRETLAQQVVLGSGVQISKLAVELFSTLRGLIQANFEI